ncbi:hypothetical protein DMENIID0001_077320 [Sergentomyia squamirostris]
MKYFCFILGFCALFWFEVSKSESVIPSQKCRDKKRAEKCILRCEYKHYNFVRKDFVIPDLYIENLKNVLLHYKAVDEQKGDQLQKHIKCCADKVVVTEKMNRIQKCEKVIEYYDCVVDGKLVELDKYSQAITAFDKTILV